MQFYIFKVDNSSILMGHYFMLYIYIACILMRTVVLDNLECDYGLLDELLMNGCLTEDVIEQINSGHDGEERNKKLITYINQSNLEKFLTGLRKVQQEHISTYIVRNGGILYTAAL